jgi:hypothetical protein
MPSDYLFQQSEVIAKKMPEFFGRFNVASNLIKKGGDVEQIGERDYRAPFLTQTGGKFGTYNPAGGPIGRGSASKGGYFVGSYFSQRLAFELTELAVKATQNRETAQFNALKRALKDGFPEFVNYVDKLWHGNGTAVLGTATAVTTYAPNSYTVYTMDTINGTQLLRRGQSVISYGNSLSAWVDSGTAANIVQIDHDARKVYLSRVVSGAGANDNLCLDGVSGASPAGLKGLLYFNSYATSGLTCGADRALELEIVTPSVDASGPPTGMKGLQLLHKILKRRGEIPKGLIGLSSCEMQAQIRQQVLNIANYDMAKGGIDADLIPGVDMTFKFAGMKMMLDINQPTDRLDFIIPGDWSRLRLADIGFWDAFDGRRFFPLYDSSTGSPDASFWFALVQHEDYLCHNPGNGGIIYNCEQPTYD